jgi:hypothetical protein
VVLVFLPEDTDEVEVELEVPDESTRVGVVEVEPGSVVELTGRRLGVGRPHPLLQVRSVSGQMMMLAVWRYV